jgi:D-serine deaminase-like pyridoxal phosphate-dependent protein
MKLADLPTPCLVLDRRILTRNLDMMDRTVARHGVALRPHMKTAKSIEVAHLALSRPAASRGGGITVSTLAEAEYFVGHGITDILLAIGITPQKLEQVTKLNAIGGAIAVVTDDQETAAAIAAMPTPPRVLIEIDCGQHRSGLAPNDPALPELARRLGPAFAGVMTHAGHSYGGRALAEMASFAEAERGAAVAAAERLAAAGFAVPIVSIGSTPTALHARSLHGVTEVRAGVYMFGDLFQSEIGSHPPADIAVTVLASVIGRRPAEGAVTIDAGALALSMDRSTAATPHDFGYGLMLDLAGRRSFGSAIVRRVWQEHGRVELDPAHLAALPVGAKVRVAPNHACHTAAAHDRYFVVDGDDTVAAVWPRVTGW